MSREFVGTLILHAMNFEHIGTNVLWAKQLHFWVGCGPPKPPLVDGDCILLV